jgi:hypothetical protein
MYHPAQLNPETATQAESPRAHRGCLVDGCPCRDARIVSFRRAAFIRALATRNGETAARVVAFDPSWSVTQAVAR